MESLEPPDKQGLVKIVFRLDASAWHGSATETLWATCVGPSQYRLENTPFFAFEVSFQDIVLARVEEGVLTFVQVIQRSGHSTYRLLLTNAGKLNLGVYWSPLREHGCTYEEGHGSLLAVDVPPRANIIEVYGCLQTGEASGTWSFEEGHCGHSVS